MLDPTGGCTVQGVYQLLSTQEMYNSNVTSDWIWHKQARLKVSILAWRVLRNRLPSKNNLVARSIISTSHNFACPDVEVSRLSNIWFFLALALLLCGAWLGRGSAYPCLIRFFYMIILFNLFGLQVVRKFVVLFYSLFGFVACGYYEMKETIEFLRTRKVPFTSCCWIKLILIRWMKVNNIN